MKKINIENKVLEKITPTNIEEIKIKEIAFELEKKIKDVIKKLKLNVEPMLVGSIAKGTYLRSVDIDIFIQFPQSTIRKDLEKYGLQIGRAVIDGEEHYAEHPYINGFYKGYEVDIVPCYKIENIEQKMSAVDRTPFHTKYIIKNLKKEQIKEVRLLKQFAKGINVYGAEAEIQGFSGYLTELLILKYGSFYELIKNASLWKFGEFIKIKECDVYKNFYEPLIFIDPVDSNRNVASALSLEKFSTFIYACKEYIDTPKIEFFFPNKVTPLSKDEIKKRIGKRDTKFMALKFHKPNLIPDILIPQIRKSIVSIKKMLEQYDFKILNSSFDVNENVFIIFELEIFELPKIKKHFGPKVWHENSKDFLWKWKRVFIENDRFVVEINRKYINAKDAIDKKLLGLSLGKNIKEEIVKGFEILNGDEIVEDGNLVFLTKFLEKKFGWEY